MKENLNKERWKEKAQRFSPVEINTSDNGKMIYSTVLVFSVASKIKLKDKVNGKMVKDTAGLLHLSQLTSQN